MKNNNNNSQLSTVNSQLPKGWKIKKLGEVCEIKNGGTPKTGNKEYWNGNINWITPKDLGKLKSRYVDNTPRKITSLGLQKSSAKLLPINSIILSTRAPIGHLAINKIEMATNQGCRGIIPNDNIFTEYVYYFLTNSVDKLNELGTGATFKELSTRALSNIQIPVPPLPEQKRIVAILDLAFALIEALEINAKQNLKNAKELFQSKLQAIFDNGQLKVDNGEWVEKTLGEIIKLEYGKPLDKSKRNFEGKYPVYGANGIKSYSNEYYYDKKTIIIGRKGSAGEINLTKNKFWPLDVTYYVLFDDTKFNLIFLYYLLLTKKLPKLAKGVKPGINRNDVYKLMTFIPKSLETQKQIVAQLDKLQAETKKLEAIYQKKIDNLEELKKSILQKAFNGQLTMEN